METESMNENKNRKNHPFQKPPNHSDQNEKARLNNQTTGIDPEQALINEKTVYAVNQSMNVVHTEIGRAHV